MEYDGRDCDGSESDVDGGMLLDDNDTSDGSNISGGMMFENSPDNSDDISGSGGMLLGSSSDSISSDSESSAHSASHKLPSQESNHSDLQDGFTGRYEDPEEKMAEDSDPE